LESGTHEMGAFWAGEEQKGNHDDKHDQEKNRKSLGSGGRHWAKTNSKKVEGEVY